MYGLLTPHTISCRERLGLLCTVSAPFIPFSTFLLREAETGVAGPGPPLQLSAAAAEGRGWSLGKVQDCPELPGDCQKCLGSFSSVPRWTMLAFRTF